ncbi:hypothetical protein Tco_1399477, partial [Tanacetum coccineum]
RRSARSVVAKLVVAVCSYYIWQERNLHLFMNQKRSHSQVTDCIKSSIRLKLLSCTFKKSKDALLFKRLWNLPDSIFRTLWHVTCVLVVVQALLEVNVDDGEVPHTVRVEYDWEPPRCGVCKPFGHDDMTSPHHVAEILKKLLGI